MFFQRPQWYTLLSSKYQGQKPEIKLLLSLEDDSVGKGEKNKVDPQCRASSTTQHYAKAGGFLPQSVIFHFSILDLQLTCMPLNNIESQVFSGKLILLPFTKFNSEIVSPNYVKIYNYYNG